MTGLATDLDWRVRLRSALPRMLIGAVVGAIALWLAFRGVSWRMLRGALAETDPYWLVGGVLSLIATLVVYTTRWWLLFTPDHRSRNWWNLFSAVLVGQAVNILVPARLGELARTYVVGSSERISKLRVFATIVVEKVVDIAFFAIAIVLLLAGTTMPDWLTRSGLALVVAAALITVATIVLAFWGKSFLAVADSIARRLPGRWAARAHDAARSGLTALQFIRSWKTAAGVSILSAVILVCSVTTNYLLFKASGIDAPYLAALFVLVVLRVGEAPPSLPGKLGVFHYLVVLALSVFGVERQFALSYSLVLYLVVVVPVAIAGVALLVTFGRNQSASVADPLDNSTT